MAAGGRYDGLLQRFGRDEPATGFVVYLDRVQQLLAAAAAVAPAGVLVGHGGDVAAAVRLAATLRASGERAVLEPEAASQAALEPRRSAWPGPRAAGRGQVLITIAVPTGTLLEGALRLLADAGLAHVDAAEVGRRLVLHPAPDLTLVTVRPLDVVAYVDHGSADLGIVGKDSLWETRRVHYELLDLGFGPCRLVMAVPEASPVGARESWPPFLRVASKYLGAASSYFRSMGQEVELIKLHGSVELAPAGPGRRRRRPDRDRQHAPREPPARGRRGWPQHGAPDRQPGEPCVPGAKRSRQPSRRSGRQWSGARHEGPGPHPFRVAGLRRGPPPLCVARADRRPAGHARGCGRSARARCR